jgi:hypothetical protein
MLRPCAPNVLAFWGLQTAFASQRIPGFGTTVRVHIRCHAGSEDRFHVLRCVFFAGGDRERADFRDALAIGWSPASFFNRQKPDSPERFNGDALWPFSCLRRGTRRIDV